MNINTTKKDSNGYFVKYQKKLKYTPTFACVLCEIYYLKKSKSTLIDERIVNKINGFLKHNLQIQTEEKIYK